MTKKRKPFTILPIPHNASVRTIPLLLFLSLIVERSNSFLLPVPPSSSSSSSSSSPQTQTSILVQPLSPPHRAKPPQWMAQQRQRQQQQQPKVRHSNTVTVINSPFTLLMSKNKNNHHKSSSSPPNNNNNNNDDNDDTTPPPLPTTTTTTTTTPTAQTSKPYYANYLISRKTQTLITSASQPQSPNHNNHNHKHNDENSHLKRAHRTLSALLSTHPTRINGVNVVHTLVLTAKILSGDRRRRYRGERNRKRKQQQRRRRGEGSDGENHEEKWEMEVKEGILKTIDILHLLVVGGGSTTTTTTTGEDGGYDGQRNHHHRCHLTTRQLANVAWAIAKIASMDYMILPPPPSSLLLSSSGGEGGEQEGVFVEKADDAGRKVLVRSEMWDLSRRSNDDGATTADAEEGGVEGEGSRGQDDASHCGQQQEKTMETMDRIAELLLVVMEENLSDIEEEENNDGDGKNKENPPKKTRRRRPRRRMDPIKSSELSMVSWAYATLTPRIIPPGWEAPPRLGKIGGVDEIITSTSTSTGNDGTKNNDDLIRFETWDDSDPNSNDDDDGGLQQQQQQQQQQEEQEQVPMTTIDRLFDAIAKTLLQKTNHTTTATTAAAADNDDDDDDDDKAKMMVAGCEWRELSNIAWSYAHRGLRPTTTTNSPVSSSLQLLQAISEEVSSRLLLLHNNHNHKNHNHILPRDISGIAWAIGNLQCDDYRLSDALVSYIDAIAATILVDIHTTTTDEQQPPPRPFQNWRSADLVQLVVALAYGRIDVPELSMAIYGEVVDSIRGEYEDREEEEEDNGYNVRRGENGRNGRREVFRSWELAVLLWAQARLYHVGGVFDEFAEMVPSVLLSRIQSVIHSQQQQRYRRRSSPERQQQQQQLVHAFRKIGLGPQERANIAWSNTVLETYKSSYDSVRLLQNIFTVSAHSVMREDGGRGGIIGLEHAHQLWQSICILEDDCPEALALLPKRVEGDGDGGGGSFYSFLKESWLREKSRPKISSLRHKNISKVLDLMGVAHYNEHDEDIDVAIVLKLDDEWTRNAEKNEGTEGDGVDITDSGENENRRKVAVEFDGPTHFTRPRTTKTTTARPSPPRALGHTVLKYKILKLQGWSVVRVPYYEFDRIPFWASMERQRYLQRKLKTHANIRFSEVDVSEYKVQLANRQSRFD